MIESKFIHPLDEDVRYEALSGERWECVTNAEEKEDGGLVCRRDSQDTLVYLPAGEWRKVRGSAA